MRSPKSVVSGYLAQRALVFQIRSTGKCLPLYPVRRLRSKPTLELSSWQPHYTRCAVGGSVLARAPCVWGDCAVCEELTPEQRFSPLLSATTRMYHHVTVDWIVHRLHSVTAHSEHPDLTPNLYLTAHTRKINRNINLGLFCRRTHLYTNILSNRLFCTGLRTTGHISCNYLIDFCGIGWPI